MTKLTAVEGHLQKGQPVHTQTSCPRPGPGPGEAEGEDAVWASVFCPPSVRARVVRACTAPAHAEPWPGYVAGVCAQLSARGNPRDAVALGAATRRRPLADGCEVAPSPSAATGRHVAEVAFSCLGWVTFSRVAAFRLRARPIEGALVRARAPFYERGLAEGTEAEAEGRTVTAAAKAEGARRE